MVNPTHRPIRAQIISEVQGLTPEVSLIKRGAVLSYVNPTLYNHTGSM